MSEPDDPKWERRWCQLPRLTHKGRAWRVASRVEDMGTWNFWYREDTGERTSPDDDAELKEALRIFAELEEREAARERAAKWGYR